MAIRACPNAATEAPLWPLGCLGFQRCLGGLLGLLESLGFLEPLELLRLLELLGFLEFPGFPLEWRGLRGLLGMLEPRGFLRVLELLGLRHLRRLAVCCSPGKPVARGLDVAAPLVGDGLVLGHGCLCLRVVLVAVEGAVGCHHGVPAQDVAGAPDASQTRLHVFDDRHLPENLFSLVRVTATLGR